jgi:hypothetical protein
MKLSRSFAIALFFLTATSGCSLIFDPSSKKAPSRRGDSGNITAPVLEQTESGVEVTWEVPSDPVDGFVIRYGEDKDNLTKEATIFKSDLREERDSQYGPIYRYILRDVAKAGKIYVAVAAFKGDVISDFSAAMGE